MGRILVVDDEHSSRKLLCTVLGDAGHAVEEADDGDVGVHKCASESFDLVIMDLKMKRMDGIEAIKEIKSLKPQQMIIVLTAYATVKTAVEAMKLGAFDYLNKPIDIEELSVVVDKALRHGALLDQNLQLKEALSEKYLLPGVIGQSEVMHEVYETVQLVAPTNATVLIYGESGTGKGLIAQAIHRLSKRKEGPFVKVNCAALVDTLLESELFGIEKRVATGVDKRIGKFEIAHGGTIFLDEVGDMSTSLQAKVLRVLQDKEFEKVGSTITQKVDTRILAATNKDLEAEVKKGNFREDLFYRLHVVPITLPSLRERGDDIRLLAYHFLGIFAHKNHKQIKDFTKEALDLLLHYHWPGNIRELENAIERAVIMARFEKILPDNLPLAIQRHEKVKGINNSMKPPEGTTVKEMERELIIKTLKETGWNKTETARRLGIGRRTLIYKIKNYQITQE